MIPKSTFLRLATALAAVLLVFPRPLPASPEVSTGRLERLEREVAELRSTLEELRGQVSSEARLQELELRLDVLAEEVEKLRVGEQAFADTTERGLGMAASKVYRVREGVALGGYGEAVLTDFADRREDGSPSGKTTTFDMLRTVFYVGYRFSDDWVLDTEIELEHATTGKGGEVSVEFAFLDWMARPWLNVRSGMVLVPMGWVNELHEPTAFLGATRPDVERHIIPTTWRELGAGLYGESGPFSYRTYVITGLDAAGFTAGGIRGGRQKGAKAKAEDWAWVGRLDFGPAPGLVLGGALYAGGVGQDLVSPAGGGVDVDVTMAELHGEWRWKGLEARLLAVGTWLDGAGDLNRALGLEGAAGVGESMNGGYLQLGYDVLSRREGRAALLPFVRWETLDTQASVAEGFAADPANDREILTLGLVYRPLDQLVFKADWQKVTDGARTGIDRFNLALGYIF